MAILRYALGVLLAAALHIGLRQFAPWLGGFFDPLLVWVTVQAIDGRAVRGMLSGVLAGWSEDAVVGETLMGMNGAATLCAGFVVALVARQLVTSSPAVLSLLFVLAVATKESTLMALQLLLTASVAEFDLLALALRAAANAAAGLLVLELRERAAGWSRRVQNSRFRRVRLGR